MGIKLHTFIRHLRDINDAAEPNIRFVNKLGGAEMNSCYKFPFNHVKHQDSAVIKMVLQSFHLLPLLLQHIYIITVWIFPLIITVIYTYSINYNDITNRRWCDLVMLKCETRHFCVKKMHPCTYTVKVLCHVEDDVASCSQLAPLHAHYLKDLE